MNNTQIRWTTYTWNAWSGCVKVSQGCQKCYAETRAERMRGSPAFPNGFELTYRPHKLRDPLRIKEPALIFANSMSDFFDERVPDDWRDRLLEVMRITPHLQYQILTKRPKVMVGYCGRRDIPDNVWLGVSVELPLYLSRVDQLRLVRASGPKFISAEPLLADLGRIDLSGISQVIAGGESGWHLRDPAIRARRGMADPPPGRPNAIQRLDTTSLENGLGSTPPRCLPGTRRSLFLEAVGRYLARLRRPYPRRPHLGRAAASAR
jgi:protein gp37